MPKKPEPNGKNGNGGIRVSYAALAAFAGLLAITGTLWKVGSAIATKTDISGLEAAIRPELTEHEMRIRTLELDMASHFGASPTSSRQSADPSHIAQASLALTDYLQSQNIPSGQSRVVVVPSVMIDAYHLQPTRGGTYAVLGQDGRYYSVDDVLALLIQIHLEEKGLLRTNQLKQ